MFRNVMLHADNTEWSILPVRHEVDVARHLGGPVQLQSFRSVPPSFNARHHNDSLAASYAPRNANGPVEMSQHTPRRMA